MDGCADNDIDRAMQIQISRVVIYNPEKHELSKLTAEGIAQHKLKFILTGETNKD